MANLTNLRVTGNNIIFSISITDSQRKLIPNTAPQTVSISVQFIDQFGNYGKFWDFTTPGFTLGPAEPILTLCPETLIGLIHTGKYEKTLLGAYTTSINYLSVHVKCTGNDKSNFYYVDFIDNQELIDNMFESILTIQNLIENQTSNINTIISNLDAQIKIIKSSKLKNGQNRPIPISSLVIQNKQIENMASIIKNHIGSIKNAEMKIIIMNLFETITILRMNTSQFDAIRENIETLWTRI